MKHITLIIPTRNRLKKLLRCLDSIPILDYLDVIVLCDGDEETHKYLTVNGRANMYNGNLVLGVLLHKRHIGSVALRNLVFSEVKDGILYATDDIEFQDGAIERAYETFNNRFKDDDGVVGFNQIEVPSFNPAGVGLVGQRFLQRYPDKQLFYHGYYHFSCQEVLWLAEKVDRFYLEGGASIKHYHPAFYKGELDKTHKEAREHQAEDAKIMNKRLNEGLIWGYNNGGLKC